MQLRGFPWFFFFNLKCLRVLPNLLKRCRHWISCLVFLLIVIISMIFIDFNVIEKGAGGYIVRVLKQLQCQEKEGPVVLKVRDGI